MAFVGLNKRHVMLCHVIILSLTVFFPVETTGRSCLV